MSTLTHRIVGLGAALALLLLAVAPPVVLVAIGAVPSPDDFSLARLTSPDDGTLAVTVIGVVAWLAWLVFTASVALELGARIRGIRAPRLPGLTLPQLTASRLLGLASLLFLAAPAAAPLVPAPSAVAAAPTPGPDASRAAPNDIATVEGPSNASQGQQHTSATVPYTVKRGDSLWRIADQHLGDGRRYTEIVTLNEAVLHGRPDFVIPGTVLRVPTISGSRAPEAESYIVQPGDTLSEIAAAQLGDASAYPRIVEASRHISQPDGDRLTDPDLIRPGWRLTIPGTTAAPSADRQTSSAPADPGQPPPYVDPTPSQAPHTPPSTAAPRADTPGDDQVRESSSVATEGSVTPGWVLPGLTGAGAILAGSLFIVLLQHRRTQQRYRRPGRIIASPPTELRAVEKTAHLSVYNLTCRSWYDLTCRSST